MSTSKFIMARKLASVQKRLMESTINDSSLDGLLPLIFNECIKENLMFWFNFMEDALVLNLRDTGNENYELNIRYAYPTVPETEEKQDYYKYQVLINAFLITEDKVTLSIDDDSNEASSQTLTKNEDGKLIISGDKPVPKHIRDAIEVLQRKGVPVTAEAIHNHLPLGQMSTSSRLECNKYLKQMEASQ